MKIKMENIGLKLNMSENLIKTIKSSSNGIVDIVCGNYLFTEISTEPEDISFIISGSFRKTIKIKIFFEILCPKKTEISLVSSFLQSSSLIFLTFLTNISSTLIISLFQYKDITDLPQFMKRKISDKAGVIFSFLKPFDCSTGVKLGNHRESFNSFSKVEALFVESESFGFDENYLKTFEYYYSDHLNNYSVCRNVVLVSDILLCFLFVIYCLCLLMFCLIDRFLYRKVLMLSFIKQRLHNFLIYFLMLIYFDNWMYLLNSLRFLKAKIFGIKDFAYITVRGVFVVYPLIKVYIEYLLSTQEKENSLKKRQILELSKFSNLLKNLLLFFLVVIHNKQLKLIILSTFAVQLIYVIWLISILKFYKRKNWAIYVQECFLLFFFVASLKFALKDSDQYLDRYLVMYFFGNSCSIFFLVFDIFDSHLKKIRTLNPSKLFAFRKMIKQNVNKVLNKVLTRQDNVVSSQNFLSNDQSKRNQLQNMKKTSTTRLHLKNVPVQKSWFGTIKE